MDISNLDTLAKKLADAALTVLVRTCREEVSTANRDDLEIACAAMRAKSATVIDQMLEDVRIAPWAAENAFRCAALDLAQIGIAALRSR